MGIQSEGGDDRAAPPRDSRKEQDPSPTGQYPSLFEMDGWEPSLLDRMLRANGNRSKKR